MPLPSGFLALTVNFRLLSWVFRVPFRHGSLPLLRIGGSIGEVCAGSFSTSSCPPVLSELFPCCRPISTFDWSAPRKTVLNPGCAGFPIRNGMTSLPPSLIPCFERSDGRPWPENTIGELNLRPVVFSFLPCLNPRVVACLGVMKCPAWLSVDDREGRLSAPSSSCPRTN